MKAAIYPGSFDPVTFGHIDIIERASKLTDHLIVGVLNNSEKSPLFSIDERVNMLKDTLKNYKNVEVESFTGLLVDYARARGVNIIFRGLRAVTDFEYEMAMAQTNRVMYSGLDTVFLTTSLKYAYLSSSMVKEIAMNNGDIDKFVPEEIKVKILKKYN